MLTRLLFTPADARDLVLPLIARFVFAATLLVYYWHAALTKLDGGPVSLSLGAYAQVFPRAFEAVGYDASQLGGFHYLVALAGTYAEFVLPLLLVIGLIARPAAIAMIGFIVIQSLTDLYGHGGIAHTETLGAWFDRLPDGVILDQRAFWVLALTLIAVKGAGALSVDQVLARRAAGAGRLQPA
ncbi:putative oxidoreductase [Roseivivax halotolerans]|uniref:Putative oxidoreductase n=1 Tax=Roseivivax halotolerans TaxID=93684 RepID=A0A1I5XUA1_9RHOB|nr:DoxX family membrane protein [Roseivivax halotolerans]SFQ35549.1 putative oxidoreductase [Roseivivax halotolerans]